jgi:hypothetical protein
MTEKVFFAAVKVVEEKNYDMPQGIHLVKIVGMNDNLRV